jgi:hypothetical protein
MYLKPLHLPKASILVLEEDPVLRAGLCGLLTTVGYVAAESANERGRAGRIDLVLAGFGPRQTPKAALDRLDRFAPLILLVDHRAWTGFDFLDAANDLGAVAVLQRPFPRSALLRLVAKVLAEPADNAGPAVRDDGELPGLAELLLHLENPNFA